MIGFETFIPFLLVLRILSAMKYSKDNSLFFNNQKYIKLFGLELIFVFLLFSCHSNDRISSIHSSEHTQKLLSDSLSVGANNINKLNKWMPTIQEKNIAIVGNQSSLFLNGTHLVDSLLALKYKIKKVFSPEHGFRGAASAGEKVASSTDPKTGLPIVSLYGSHKKPTPEDLKGIDLVIFDIQDVGVRFYTYISTLNYVMEDCAENGVPLVILDRPNPNGDYVDGPILEAEHKSFVGMHPVPIVHGMTIGEYGRMVNGEYWLKDSLQCTLKVIPCQNYNHQMHYSLPVAPSPNLRSDASIRLYPSLCLFEATDVSVGRGTSKPFEWFGHPRFPESSVSFVPESIRGAAHPKHEGSRCYAIQPEVDPNEKSLNLSHLLKAKSFLEGETFITKKSFFKKLAGTEKLYNQILSGMDAQQIRESWQEDLNRFKKMRENYLLYD
jgi:uncharacterized protein YbbC (DUF1343 family)